MLRPDPSSPFYDLRIGPGNGVLVLRFAKGFAFCLGVLEAA